MSWLLDQPKCALVFFFFFEVERLLFKKQSVFQFTVNESLVVSFLGQMELLYQISVYINLCLSLF